MCLVFHISNTPCQRSRQLESHLKSRLALKLYNVIRFRCCTTGWSKETVDCNFLLKDQKISTSVKTQWFLKSLYREVLVFWCFKSVRLVEFCLLERFHYRAMAAPYKAWTEHLYTPWVTSKPYKHFFSCINICIDICTQTPPPGISRQFRPTTDTNRHQMTPTGGPRLPKRLFKDVWRLGLTSNGICWCLLVSDGVC